MTGMQKGRIIGEAGDSPIEEETGEPLASLFFYPLTAPEGESPPRRHDGRGT